MSSMKPSDACTVNDNGPRGASCWKEPRMSAPFKAALALAAVIVVFVAGFAMLGGSGGVIGGVAGPTASPSPSPSPTPTPTPATLVNGMLEAGTYSGTRSPANR